MVLWDVPEKKEIREYAGANEGIRNFTFLPDGQRFAAVTSDGAAALYKLVPSNENQDFEADLTDPKRGYVCLAVSPDGAKIVLGSECGEIDVWQVDPLKRIGSLPKIRRANFEPSRGFMADIRGNLKEIVNEDDGAAIYQLLFFPDSRHLVVSTRDATILIYDIECQDKVLKCRLPNQPTVYSDGKYSFKDQVPFISALDLSPEGDRILFTDRRDIYLWELKPDRVLSWPSGHINVSRFYCGINGTPGSVANVAFSADGKLAITSGADTTLKMWQLPEDRASGHN